MSLRGAAKRLRRSNLQILQQEILRFARNDNDFARATREGISPFAIRKGLHRIALFSIELKTTTCLRHSLWLHYLQNEMIVKETARTISWNT